MTLFFVPDFIYHDTVQPRSLSFSRSFFIIFARNVILGISRIGTVKPLGKAYPVLLIIGRLAMYAVGAFDLDHIVSPILSRLQYVPDMGLFGYYTMILCSKLQVFFISESDG